MNSPDATLPAVEKYYPKGEKSESTGSDLLIRFQPKLIDQFIDRYYSDPNNRGIESQKGKFISPVEYLAKTRTEVLKNINSMSPLAREALVDREIDAFETIRARYQESLDHEGKPTRDTLALFLNKRFEDSKSQIVKLYNANALNAGQVKYVEKWLKGLLPPKIIPRPTTFPEKTPEPPTLPIKERPLAPIDTIFIDAVARVQEQTAAAIAAKQIVKPLIPLPKLEPSPLPSALTNESEIARTQGEMVKKLGTEAKKLFEDINSLRADVIYGIGQRLLQLDYLGGDALKRLDPKPILNRVWNNKKFRLAFLTGLEIINATTSGLKFKPGDFDMDMHAIADAAQNIPAAVQNLSAEAQNTIDQARNNLGRSASPSWKWSHGINPSPVQELIIEKNPEIPEQKEEIIEPPIKPEAEKVQPLPEPKPKTLQSLIKFDTSFNGFGKGIESHSPPRKPVSESPYAHIGVDMKANIAYGIGDISSIDELNAMVGDFNAKTIRISISGNSLAEIRQDWNNRAKAIIKQAHVKGLNVRTVISLTHLPSEKDWENFMVETIQTPPVIEVSDDVQIANEVGWCASDGTPEQYFLEPKERISDKDHGLPRYVKIQQDVIKASKKNVGITLPSLAFTYAWYDDQIRAYYKGMLDAGVDLNNVEIDSHVFLTEVLGYSQHPDGDESNGGFKDLLRQQAALRELGIKDPNLVMNEAYFGPDMTQIQIEAYLKYQHEVLGVKTIVLHPVTGRYDNVKKK